MDNERKSGSAKKLQLGKIKVSGSSISGSLIFLLFGFSQTAPKVTQCGSGVKSRQSIALCPITFLLFSFLSLFFSSSGRSIFEEVGCWQGFSTMHFEAHAVVDVRPVADGASVGCTVVLYPLVQPGHCPVVQDARRRATMSTRRDARRLTHPFTLPRCPLVKYLYVLGYTLYRIYKRLPSREQATIANFSPR